MPTLPLVLLQRRKSARAPTLQSTSRKTPRIGRITAATGARWAENNRITVVQWVLAGTRNRPKPLFCRDFSRCVNAVHQNRAKIIDVRVGRPRGNQAVDSSKKS